MLKTKHLGDADGFTPEQRFFIGWGQMWCENRSEEIARLHARTNPHSPGRYRTIGVVSNMPEFQKAFSCSGERQDGEAAGLPRLVMSRLGGIGRRWSVAPIA